MLDDKPGHSLNVVPLPPAEDSRKAQVIEELRKALTEAEKGNIDFCAIILRKTDAKWSFAYSQVPIMSETIGRIEILKQDMIQKYLSEPVQ